MGGRRAVRSARHLGMSREGSYKKEEGEGQGAVKHGGVLIIVEDVYFPSIKRRGRLTIMLRRF